MTQHAANRGLVPDVAVNSLPISVSRRHYTFRPTHPKETIVSKTLFAGLLFSGLIGTSAFAVTPQETLADACVDAGNDRTN